MKPQTKTLLFFLFNLFVCLAFSQNETNKWYFGNHAGLDFMTSPPTILTNGAINTIEGCASMSDTSGNLMFYTDGITVYNKMHIAMANGTGLTGNSSSSQSAIIAKQPGNSTVYYVFTQSGPPGAGSAFSIVDMSLAAGMGSVTVKNTTLSAICTEKLTSVKHCNGSDIWVIIHDWNSADFKSFLLSSTGVNTTPVISTIGTTHSINPNYAGCMKTSPNGKKLALAIHGLGAFELYDLDNSTGVISHSLSLTTNAVNKAYGVEFSPDGTKLYGGTGYSNGFLYQWNLCAGNDSLIVASKYPVYTSTAGIAAMQAASDGKIYAARYNQSTLGVINNPNVLGAGCNYVDLGQSIAPKSTVWSIPNFITSYFKTAPTPFTYSSSCTSYSFDSSPTFSLSVACGGNLNTVTGLLWNFGDANSGTANTSTLTNPVHNYSAIGTYTTQLVIYYQCSSDTIRAIITPTAVPPALNVTGTFTLCKGDKQILTATGANNYTWSTGIQTSTILISPTITTVYSVSSTYSNTCMQSKQFTITVNKCTSLQNITKEESWFNIYPNPSNGSVSFETSKELEINLTDFTGKPIRTIPTKIGTTQVDLEDLPSGVYLLRLATYPNSKPIRFIKTD
ncbi:T9SS type A sorting domain-containing protein [Aurantibacillus circumpalustris]|uniref:T9SS type A sorting domain-containing protein n=1 Tax=Aurantibacillus circumpalustris TaxID=3036359 RepID=UPI00295BD416|nr:T9SS type A sorting domain-containing protein [Aurantibacillus circumpalustris]